MRNYKVRIEVRILALLAVIILLLAGCLPGRQIGENDETQYIIGVAAYDPDSAEMNMFMNYYRDYIEEGFPVRFYFSDRLTSAEDEQAFIRLMKQKGAKGIISFYGPDVGPVLETCEEEQIYYVLGSGTLSDEEFAQAEDNPYFLGTIGPRPSDEAAAGANMAAYFWGSGARKLLILGGGATQGNYMHEARVEAMLETLASLGGFDFDPKELEKLEGITTVQAGDSSVTIALGYFSQDGGKAAVKEALSQGDYDAVLSAYYIDAILPMIAAREAELGHSIRAGAVDCFSESNFEVIKQSDAFGNPQIDYIEGKYASMAGPAFAALYNAMSGDLDVVSPDGKAFRLYQSFWTAQSREEFVTMYGYTTGIYENAYSCADLMQAIRVYNPDADFETLRSLTEASDVDSVKARILAR